MKRFDRAMYAFFLLALLADVARAHASVPLGSDSGGSAILAAPSPLRVAPAEEANPVPRRTTGAFPSIAKLRSFALRMSGWARVLGGQSSTPVVLTASVASRGYGFNVGSLRALQPASPSPGIFEHTGSPAP